MDAIPTPPSSPPCETSKDFSFGHEHLGEVIGQVRSDNVVQFRSIPFGRVPARFRQAVLVDELLPEERNCTTFSYACPQLEQDDTGYGGPISTEPARRYDEFRCLNMTVTAPRHVLVQPPASRSLVPVMVYIHGGAFTGGAHYGRSSDAAPMVELSCRDGTPVIIVNIHYRLNWFGFLACEDLLADAAAHGEPPCNYGLFDQRLAFLWLHKHIQGFGGDPKQITAFGESAGSASIAVHMCSTVPLFNRAILQSGSPSTCTPVRDQKEIEASYHQLLEYCGIEQDDPHRLRKLRETVSADTLVQAVVALDRIVFYPLDHSSFFPVAPNFNNEGSLLSACSWVQEVVIGDCFDEGYLFSPLIRHVRCQNFIQRVQELVGEGGSIRILAAYGIFPGMDDNLFWRRIATLMGDVMFSVPCHNIARALALPSSNIETVYRYSLTLRNPFIGSMCTGISGHHGIDLIYQFMTLLDRFPDKREQVASIDFARRWICFAQGKAPWKPYKQGEQSISIADSHVGWILRTREEDEALSARSVEGPRRYFAWEEMTEVLDGLDRKAQISAVAGLSLGALGKGLLQVVGGI